MRRWIAILVWTCCLSAFAAEVIPPKPENHFNDYAHVVDSATAATLNDKLVNLERASSDQVVVAVYPNMQSDSSIEDYTVRVARAWGVGLKGTNNGAVLFVFTNDRKMFIQVGYGLEGALPDATCKQITEYEIKPHFKAGDYAGGLTAGVDSIIAAVKHEYKGVGSTIREREYSGRTSIDLHDIFPLVFAGIMAAGIILPLFMKPKRRGWVYRSSGWGGYSTGGIWNIGNSWSGGGSGSDSGGGGGGSSGGGGSFSGGGGSFGGGGAGSSW